MEEFIDIKLAARVLGTTVEQVLDICSLADVPLIWRDEERGIGRNVLARLYKELYAAYGLSQAF